MKWRKTMKKIMCFWILFLLTVVSAEAGKQQPRSFYLTRDFFTGSEALSACADGYHMASLLEIFDSSNFKYDTTVGLRADDSGSGHPSFAAAAWIRTGYASSGQSQIAGEVNCFAWTSNTILDSGTIVGLNPNWALSSTVM